MIKKNILKIPSIGSIGYHPAKLPMNRGRHPIIWSLVLGLKNNQSYIYKAEISNFEEVETEQSRLAYLAGHKKIVNNFYINYLNIINTII